MGCDSCSSGSCSTKPNDGLPPGMLQKYRLNIDRSDGFLVWIETERGPDGSIRVCDHCKELLGKIALGLLICGTYVVQAILLGKGSAAVFASRTFGTPSPVRALTLIISCASQPRSSTISSSTSSG